MRRSRILDGKEQQRSRAKLRKRLDRSAADPETDEEAVDRLRGHLSTVFAERCPVTELERLDLNAYLDDTSGFPFSSTERLRQLAIHLEDRAYGPQPRSWLVLRRIYDLAERLVENRDDRWEVLRSRAISAHYLAPSEYDESPKDSAARKRLFADAYEAALKLQEIHPDWAESYSLLAQIRYRDTDGDREEGLAEADKALAIDPKHPWALWHRAALLRELERWSEAVDAYNALDPAFFTGHRAVRYEWALESRAYCRLRAGARAGAIEEFEALLARYEKNPHLAKDASWLDIAEAASGRLRSEIGERARALIAKEAEWALWHFDDEDKDDPDFLRIVERVLSGTVVQQSPAYVAVVKIDHWFGQKWRGFVGKMLGLVGASRKRNFVIPPFHPNRVHGEWQYLRQEDGSYIEAAESRPIHIHQNSENNWRRRIHRIQAASVWMWWSGKTMKGDRASLMVYIVRGEGDDEAWYVEYTFKEDDWVISKLVGVDRHRLEQMMEADQSQLDSPWHGERPLGEIGASLRD